ncbi:siderophore synthetase [Kribbella sp. NBC_01505]|uniref:IucA/IucC family protein n=1 Tax=Kribbella sp. NBC_01505 TaxID=2903580 RepID=UPI00386F935D
MTSTETAVAAHLNAILRCYTREAAVPVTAGVLRLAVGAKTVTARVEHASRSGWHQFTEILVDGVPPAPEELVRLLSTEADPAEIDDLVARTAESVRNVAYFVDAGGADRGPGRFLEIEQALLFGQPNHPAPKSRDGLSGAELARYSPELGGRFAVHWFEADTELVSSDQVAGAPSLQGLDAVQLMGALAGITPSAGRVLIPAHPWQAAALRQRPRVAKLLEEGRVKELGPHGAQWYPTSSMRTLYHPDLPVMLKLSLGLRITNSRRESTPTELRRGLEVYRLLDAAYNAGTATAHPRFTIVRDPAWIALDEGGPALTGLDVAVREVPNDVNSYACLAGLVAPRPDRLSRLSEFAADDPAAWVASYLDSVLIPMLHLYAETGIGLEAHQQNTLIRLDGLGRIKGGAYRDNQGYYLASSYLRGLLAVTGLRDSALAVVDDATVDDRLTGNLLYNQALAVVGCLAADGVADEAELLDVVRDRLILALPLLQAAGPDGDRLARRWLTADTLPCQANLSTVYLNIPNPLTA